MATARKIKQAIFFSCFKKAFLKFLLDDLAEGDGVLRE